MRLFVLAFCICAGLAVGGAQPVAAEEAVVPEPLVSNIFMDTDLRQALQDIATQAEVTIIPDPSVGGYVTAELTDLPLNKALEIVLAGTGYAVQKTEDYILVYSPDPKSPAFAEVSETHLVRLDYLEAEAAMRMLPAQYATLVRADTNNHALLIHAPGPLAERIVADLQRLDTAPRHVLLDARVVVLEHSNLLNLGLEWDYPTLQAGAFTTSDYHGGGLPGPDWPWAVQIGYTPGREFTNSLLVALNLLSANEEATIVANPQLMAQEGKSAELKVATEEYFKITSGGYYNQVDLEQIETGTVLTILPRVSRSGEITLSLLAEVSDVVGRGEDNLPVVTRRTAKSTVRVEDGGTVAVAGLMDSRSRQRLERTPGAASLPLVGYLFRNTVNDLRTRQIAVFVTAQLVPEGPADRDRIPPDRPYIEPVDEEQFRQALRESLARLRAEKGVQR